MKKVISNLIITTVIGLIAVTTARGQFSTITLDEAGKGFYNGALVSSASLPDPFNGNISHFAYILPFAYLWSVPAADIQVFEPGPTPQQPSDLLRFTRDPNGPNTLLFFYSDASAADPPDDPADVLTMPAPVFPYLSGTEIGLFGNPYSEAGPNGFVYMANPGMPGEDGTGVPLQYTFISDAGVVPEPNAGLLAGLGGGCLLLASRSLRTLRRK
jgi:hypothetical protein